MRPPVASVSIALVVTAAWVSRFPLPSLTPAGLRQCMVPGQPVAKELKIRCAVQQGRDVCLSVHKVQQRGAFQRVRFFLRCNLYCPTLHNCRRSEEVDLSAHTQYWGACALSSSIHQPAKPFLHCHFPICPLSQDLGHQLVSGVIQPS